MNYNITKANKTVRYPTVAEAIEMIRIVGKGCYSAKSDISEAFRLLPLHPDIYHLMGFKWEGLYYYGLCLPMGCGSSCHLFPDAIMFAINKVGEKHAVKVLGDFLIVELKKPVCKGNFDIFLCLCKKAGIPTAQHKTVGPDTCTVFLGVELDTILMITRLPRDKLVRYSGDVTELISQRKVTLKELQVIIGQLQYATSVVTPGKAFLRCLINLTIGHTKPHYYIPLRKEAILDLTMWNMFLYKYNGGF